MPEIIWFRDCHHGLQDLVGGKNSSLGELYNLSQSLDLNIADGFAISTLVYKNFLKFNNLDTQIQEKLLTLNSQDLDQLQSDSRYLQQLFQEATFPPKDKQLIIDSFEQLCSQYSHPIQVAVRSSAVAEDLPNASFAGQQDTYLNISNSDDLIKSVIECFASLFNNRAISYRDSNQIPYEQVSISVGIQRMIRSDLGSAGVGFSLDPNSGYSKAIVINSAWGLGELVVSGGVKPDEFIVDKRTLNAELEEPILSKHLGHKQSKIVYSSQYTQEIPTSPEELDTFSLQDKQIKALASTILNLEDYYSKLHQKEISVDVEWAYDGLDHKMYIIQTRPETVHSQKENISVKTFKLQQKSEVLGQGVSVGEQISSGPIKILSTLDQHEHFQPGDILVTEMTTPDWEPLMKISSGVITNKGGKTCHAAIVARELGVNACVGTGNGTQLLEHQPEVTIDCSSGDIGYIYEGQLPFEVESLEIDTCKKLPVKLMLNVGSPENSFQASLLPHSGIGLTRMEFIINNYIKVHPLALLNYPHLPDTMTQEISNIMGKEHKCGSQFFIYQLSHGVAKIASGFYPHPVIVRLSDFKSNEYKNLLGGHLYEPEEENPMIGWRGASRYYSPEYLEAFKLECQALKYARTQMGMTNIVIMIPFCRTPEECQQVIKIMEEQGLVRGQDGLQIYLMCEIPSNVIEADRFSPYIDGVSIGGNDLLQLTLGIDRDSDMITGLSQHTNISYRRLINQSIREYKKQGVKVGFCGQQPSDSPEFCEFLVSEGIDSISVTPDSALKIYKHLSF